MVLRPGEDRTVSLEFPVSNHSDHGLRATVRVHVGGASVPVDLGLIPAGAERSAKLQVDLQPGRTSVSAELLAGP